MMRVAFIVPGRPQSKGSMRAVPIRTKVGQPTRIAITDGNKRARPWESRISFAAAEAMLGAETLIRGPVAAELMFYFARPKGHYGTGRNSALIKLSAPRYMATLPDVDKLARCALDALTGVVIFDDSQVARLTAIKNYGEPERLEVKVQAI